MKKFLLVLKNLKHDGDLLEAGSLFEGAVEEFQQLIDMGVLKVIEGAKTLDEAAEMAKAQVAEIAEKVKSDALKSNHADVWKAKPNVPPVVTPPVPAPEAQKTDEASTTGQAPVVGAGDLPPAPVETGDNL
jgi:hypothetical protein